MKTVGPGLSGELLQTAAQTAILRIEAGSDQFEFAIGFKPGKIEGHAARFRNGEAGAIDFDFLGAAVGTVDAHLAIAVYSGHVTDECLGVAESAVKKRQRVHHLRTEILPA